MIQVTPSDVVLWLGLLLTVLNIIDRAAILRDRGVKPHMLHEKRIDQLEDDVEKIRAYLSNDNLRIKSLEQGNRVMLHCMGALLSHGIDGNNIDEMRLAREELNEYLIQK